MNVLPAIAKASFTHYTLAPQATTARTHRPRGPGAINVPQPQYDGLRSDPCVGPRRWRTTGPTIQVPHRSAYSLLPSQRVWLVHTTALTQAVLSSPGSVGTRCKGSHPSTLGENPQCHPRRLARSHLLSYGRLWEVGGPCPTHPDDDLNHRRGTDRVRFHIPLVHPRHIPGPLDFTSIGDYRVRCGALLPHSGVHESHTGGRTTSASAYRSVAHPRRRYPLFDP